MRGLFVGFFDCRLDSFLDVIVRYRREWSFKRVTFPLSDNFLCETWKLEVYVSQNWTVVEVVMDFLLRSLDRELGFVLFAIESHSGVLKPVKNTAEQARSFLLLTYLMKFFSSCGEPTAWSRSAIH